MGKRANGEGSIYKDQAKGRWVAVVSHEGRRFKKTAKTRQEAVERKKELERQLREQPQIQPGRLTMAQVLDEWFAKKVDPSTNAASTKEAKAWAVERLKAQLGRRRASELSYRDVESTLQRLGDEGLSKESLIKIRSVLNQVCLWARQRKYMADNPVAVAHLPKTTPTRPRRSLTVDEARAFRELIRGDELEAFWLVMLMSGLRSGEARALRWEDWNPEEGTLAVRRNVRREGGRYDTDAELKTAQSRRTLEVPSHVQEALEDLRLSRTGPSSGLIFSTSSGNVLDTSNMLRRLRSLCKEAGIRPVTLHELRHTAASLLAADGVAAEHIADFLGHAGTRMTLKTYRHVLAPAVSAGKRPMDSVFA